MKNYAKAFANAAGNTKRVLGSGVKAMLRDPQITIYAYLAVIVIWLTSPFVSKYVLDLWHHFERPEFVMAGANTAPHILLARVGLVAFSAFYAIFITAYFTCAVSASVWAKLNGRPTGFLFGLRAVGRRFWRVTKFALLAIFFFPLAVWAQRKKLPRGIIGVIGSSFTMSMTQLAPAVMTKDEDLFETVSHTVNTLGEAWHESLMIRVITFLSVFGLGAASFIIKLVQHYFFHGETARITGWFTSIILGVGFFVAAKVISTVLTTTLFYKVTHKQL